MKKLFTPLSVAMYLLLFQNMAICAPVASCDTITNITSRDTLIYYLNDSAQGGGYLSGNNGYGDEEKAEELSGPVGSQLTGAFIGFGYINIQPGDSGSTVTINAYDATGAGGSPGATIATATVTLQQIAYSIGGQLYVAFPSGPTLAANKFFVSVVLPTSGDTIAVLTTTFFSLDGNGWERWSDGTWHAYNVTYGTFPYDFGNDIAAITCGGGPLAAFQSNLANTCGNSLTVQFYNTSSNGTDSIFWSFPGGSPDTSTSANPTVTFSDTGTYTVNLYAYGAGLVDSTSSTVIVTPAITDSIITTPATGSTGSNGTATVIGLTGAQPLTFQWYDANGDTSETITGLTPGVYYLTIYSATGCYLNDSAVVTFINGIVNISTNKQANVFPNPASQELNVDFNIATTAEMRISDITGRIISVFSAENTINNTLDIQNLTSGSYILTIVDKASKAEQSVKFVKL
jgi:PKD repeat protein